MTLRLRTGTSGLLNKQWGKTIIKSGGGGGGGQRAHVPGLPGSYSPAYE